eukprot:4436684-Pleurochrysis_carterae.AAC.1
MDPRIERRLSHPTQSRPRRNTITSDAAWAPTLSVIGSRRRYSRRAPHAAPHDGTKARGALTP